MTSWMSEITVPANRVEEAQAAISVGLFFIYGTHGRCGKRWDASGAFRCPKPAGHRGRHVPFAWSINHGPVERRTGLVRFER